MTPKMGNNYDPELILVGNKFDPRQKVEVYLFLAMKILYLQKKIQWI